MRVQMTENRLAPIYKPAASKTEDTQARPVWIAPPSRTEAQSVVAYRLRFTLATAQTVRVHVTADERYELWLDGRRMGRGPERGSASAWFYESYDLPVATGEHVLVARVWHLGELAPLAQVSTAPGFLLVADPPHASLLSTGVAAWEVKPLSGYAFELPAMELHSPWFTGANQTIDASLYPWGVEYGSGQGWLPARSRHEDALTPFGILPLHVLREAMLPAQLSAPRRAGRVRSATEGTWTDPRVVHIPAEPGDEHEVRAWQDMVDGLAPLTVPARARRQVVLDLEQYYCAYPYLVTSGGQGSTVTLAWSEALYVDSKGSSKGQRNQVADRYFIGPSRDVIRPDGGTDRRFENLWWRAGRYLLLLVETADEPLTLEAVGLEETRYPLEAESRIALGDERLDRTAPILLRGLQMCAHETYLDCPYYEEMMYVGDTRLEALTTYVLSLDDRLPRKSITMFDLSRVPEGLTQARFPGRDVQIIPPFALWWVGMLHDYALWRGNQEFVTRHLPGARAVLNGFLRHLNGDGLLVAPAGWNFADWVPDWPIGVPPEGFGGVSGLLNWHLVYTLALAAQLEDWAGDPELAHRFERERCALASRLISIFWDERRGLFADDPDHQHFSEHTQCLSLLSGALDMPHHSRIAQGLLEDATLTRTTIYFTHYLFEAYRLLGLADALFERLRLWYDLPAQGFMTTPEQPEPTRSDCHGWGAHPLYHSFATILGIRPATFGFGRLEIEPLLGPLHDVSGSLVHPRGRVDVQLRVHDGRLSGRVSLPEGVTGILDYQDRWQELTPGSQTIDIG